MMPPQNPNEWKEEERNRGGELPQRYGFSHRVSNLAKGTVTSLHQGLVRMGCHVKLDEGATLRVRWPTSNADVHPVQIGEQVTVSIPSHAVVLGVPALWPGKRRWNKWEGRVVLVEPAVSGWVLTVKVLGEPLTLRSTAPVLGLERVPQTWDPVNILIDPEKMKLVRYHSAGRPLRPRLMTEGMHAPPESRVWLVGHLETVRQTMTGWLLSLEIGKARVSALVGGDEDLSWGWMPGMEVEMSVGQWEAWVKPRGRSVHPVLCRLLYENV